MPVDTTLGLAKKGLSGLITQQGALPVMDEALAVYIQFDKTAADGAAATTTTDTFVWINPYNVPVYLVSAIGAGLGAGITADATNNATITFRTINMTGGASAAALTIVTDLAGGSWTSNQSKAITNLTKANAAVPVGGGITFSIAKGGTGVVVPISKFTVKAFKAES
jgi:hypothetical protein